MRVLLSTIPSRGDGFRADWHVQKNPTNFVASAGTDTSVKSS